MEQLLLRSDPGCKKIAPPRGFDAKNCIPSGFGCKKIAPYQAALHNVLLYSRIHESFCKQIFSQQLRTKTNNKSIGANEVWVRKLKK